MIAQSIHEYVWFGTCIRFLQDAPQNVPLRGLKGGGILDNIESFFRHLQDLGLVVTTRTTSDLTSFMKTLGTQSPEAKLTGEQSSSLSGIMNQIRTTLEAELQGFEAFVVTPKRLDVRKLLDDMPGLLGPNVFSTLPTIAQYDLHEAGTCIAFERTTAAAFHLLRGTESVLREFYSTLATQKRVGSLWGPMVTDLRKRRKAQKYSVLLDHLDNIRRSFRNPTQHPEMIYTIHEVQDLFGLCVDAINRMSVVFPTNTG